METPSTTPQEGTRSPRALPAIPKGEPVIITAGKYAGIVGATSCGIGADTTPNAIVCIKHPDAPGGPHLHVRRSHVEAVQPKADPAGSPRAHTMGGSLDTSGYLPPLEEQADPAGEHTIAALPVGSMVRIDDDEGHGIRGSIAPVVQSGRYGRVTVEVGSAGMFDLAAEHVTGVIYDYDTHSWVEGAPSATPLPKPLQWQPEPEPTVTNDPRCREPHLGLATTRQLIDELSARIEVHGPGLDYRTVDPS